MRQRCDERRVHSVGRIALTPARLSLSLCMHSFPPSNDRHDRDRALTLASADGSARSQAARRGPLLATACHTRCLKHKQGSFSGIQPGQVTGVLKAILESTIQQVGAYFGSKKLELEPRTSERCVLSSGLKPHFNIIQCTNPQVCFEAHFSRDRRGPR